MVAVIGGNSLGLFDASSVKTGTDTGIGQGQERIRVNAATGNLVLQHQDQVLVGRGVDDIVVRTYNSKGTFDDDNGDNFRFSFSQQLKTLTGTVNNSGSTVTRIHGDGSESVFTYDSTTTSPTFGKYVSTSGDGAHDTLSYNSGTETWTYVEGSSGLTETYDWISSVGKMQTQLDREGKGMRKTWSVPNSLVEELLRRVFYQ